jgi:hypothetical protein
MEQKQSPPCPGLDLETETTICGTAVAQPVSMSGTTAHLVHVLPVNVMKLPVSMNAIDDTPSNVLPSNRQQDTDGLKSTVAVWSLLKGVMKLRNLQFRMTDCSLTGPDTRSCIAPWGPIGWVTLKGASSGIAELINAMPSIMVGGVPAGGMKPLRSLAS